MTKLNNGRLTNFNPRLSNQFNLTIKAIDISLIIHQYKDIIINLTDSNDTKLILLTFALVG